MTATNLPLPACAVDVVEEGGRAKREFVRCEIGRHLYFSSQGLESYLFAKPEPLIHDALLVAAAVEFCDRLRQRSSVVWGRSFSLRLPVYEVDRWRTSAVTDALIDALDFVTGDRWTIHFRPRRQAAMWLRQEQFDLSHHKRAVMPFSDGLDSWSVATLEDANARGLLRVRLGKAPPPRPARGREPAFTRIPYKVKFHEHRDRESSSRSRGFKFAMMSGIAAYLAKVDGIILPESGQGIIGPAMIVPGQAAPDYRCHPRFTTKMERLVMELFGHRVRYKFPRLWNTKGETLRAAISAAASASGWDDTRSCWQSQRHMSIDGERR